MGIFIWHVGEVVLVWECSSGMEVRWWWYGNILMAWR